MASKGPKSTIAPSPAESIPAALAATPVVPPAKPVAAPKKAAAAPKPAPKPTVVVPAPVVPEIAPVIVQTPEPVVAAAAAVIQKEAEVMETVQSATDTAQARAQTLFAEANDRTKSAIEKSSKLIEEMNDFSKGNIEALVESSKIAAKGIETLGQEAADYGRKQLESATAALKTLSSIKSPTDFMKLHSDYMRSAFDAMVAETSKNTESMLKLAGEIAQPISNRVALAAEKIKVAA
jgi:phasin family protein